MEICIGERDDFVARALARLCLKIKARLGPRGKLKEQASCAKFSRAKKRIMI